MCELFFFLYRKCPMAFKRKLANLVEGFMPDLLKPNDLMKEKREDGRQTQRSLLKSQEVDTDVDVISLSKDGTWACNL